MGGLAVNENVATQPCEVGRRIFEDRINVEYRLEEGAARAVETRLRRDHLDAFRTVPIRKSPIEDIWSKVCQGRDLIAWTTPLTSSATRI